MSKVGLGGPAPELASTFGKRACQVCEQPSFFKLFQPNKWKQDMVATLLDEEFY